MNKINALLISGLSLMGMASQAYAMNPFTVNPDSINGSLPDLQTFVATNVNGISSGLISLDLATKTATESGWLNITAFNNGGTAIDSAISGLNGVSYQLFLSFNLSAKWDVNLSTPAGTFSKNGSGYQLTSLTYTMFADPTNNTVFTPANTGGSLAGTQATFSPAPLSDLIEIANGSLIAGTSGIQGGGVSLNALTTINLTAAGANYFVSPTPFYNLMFNAYNNTTGSVQADYNFNTGCTAANEARPGGCEIAIVNGVGTMDYLNVPEPTTLALLGFGLLGLGKTKRRI